MASVLTTEAGGPLAALGYKPAPKRRGGGFGPLQALEDIGAAIGAAAVTAATGGALFPEASLGTLAAIGAGAAAATQAGLTRRPGGVVQALAQRQRSRRVQPQRETPVESGLLPTRGQVVPHIRQVGSRFEVVGSHQVGSDLSTELARQPQPTTPNGIVPLVNLPPPTPPSSTLPLQTQPAEQPCTDCGSIVTPLPPNCSPTLKAFAEQFAEYVKCGAFEKQFHLEKPMPHQPTVTVRLKQPICVCADDAADLKLWFETQGGYTHGITVINPGADGARAIGG
ncbi:MAG: hypothetical protein M1582_05150 [Actinobacteria bacterium]|jgi:hypothetical protein|nr:hypothetical protein [Actinomycetota bacterium]